MGLLGEIEGVMQNHRIQAVVLKRQFMGHGNDRVVRQSILPARHRNHAMPHQTAVADGHTVAHRHLKPIIAVEPFDTLMDGFPLSGQQITAQWRSEPILDLTPTRGCAGGVRNLRFPHWFAPAVARLLYDCAKHDSKHPGRKLMPQDAFNVRPLRAFQDNYIWSLEWPTG